MTESDARKIAEVFAAENAKCVYGSIVRAILLGEENERLFPINPKEAHKFSGKKEWSIGFDLLNPETIPRTLIVVVDDATGEASFFNAM